MHTNTYQDHTYALRFAFYNFGATCTIKGRKACCTIYAAMFPS